MKKVTKGSAFLISNVMILVLTIGGIVIDRPEIGGALAAVVSLAGLYIGGNVWDNKVQGVKARDKPEGE